MLPDIFLILDLETTGADPEQHQVIELGAILYSVKHRCTLQQLSMLFPVSENPQQAVNHISAAASQVISEGDSEPAVAIALFKLWLERADYVVAHYANFDKQWFGKAPFPTIDKPWLCTYDDFLWPRNTKSTNLVATALNHGIGVSSAHRALTDCQLIAALFDRVAGFEKILETAIERTQEAWYYVVAKVDYKDKDLAKERGFWWDGEKKEWHKTLREHELQGEYHDYPFQVECREIAK